MQKSSKSGLLRGISRRLAGSVSSRGVLESRAYVTTFSPAAFVITACLAISPFKAFAQELLWDPDTAAGVQGGVGIWNNNNNNDTWTATNGASNTDWDDDATAVFSAGAGLVTLDGTVDIGGLVFNSDGYIVNGNGTGQADILDIEDRNVNLTVTNAGEDAVIGVEITGSGGVNVNGAGILVLQGDNSYDGLTRITGNGGLRIGPNGSIDGGATVTDGVLNNRGTVSGGVTNDDLVINSANAVINGGLTNNATGIVNTNGEINGGVTNDGRINAAGTINGGFSNQGAGVLQTTGTLDIDGSLDNNSSAATGVFVAANTSLSATSISNQANSTISNLGTITSTNPIQNAGVFNTSRTVNADISNGGTLNASGSINGDVSNSAGGVINTTGALSVGNSNNPQTLTNISAGAGDFAGVNIGLNESLTVANLNNYAGATLVNNGTLTSNIFNAGTLTSTINVIGSITNGGIGSGNVPFGGTVDARGLMTGTLTNAGTGVLNTIGTEFRITGTLNNSSPGTGAAGTGGVNVGIGELLSATQINNLAGGSIINEGTLESANSIVNVGLLATTGTVNAGIINEGTVNAQGNMSGAFFNTGSGVLATTGDFSLNGTLFNNSTSANGVSIGALESLSATNITNQNGATIVNAGRLNSGSPIINNGTISNSGAVTGGINNYSVVNNSGTVSGTFVSTGSVTNTGTIENGLFSSGTLTNSGLVNGGVTSSGNIFNSGTIAGGLIAQGGQVQNLAGATIQGGTTINGADVSSIGTLTGQVVLNSGSLNVAGAGNSVLDDSLSLAVNNGTLFVTNSETIGGLSGNGGVLGTGGVIDIAGGQYLQVNQSTSQSFSGVLANTGTFSLVGSGGSLTLTGNSSAFAGNTGISGSNLLLSSTAGLGGNVAIGGFGVTPVPTSTLTVSAGANVGGNVAVGSLGVLNANGTIGGTVTVNATGSVGGAGGTLGGLVLNGGDALAGATLNVAGTTTVNSGTMAAALNGQGTGTFAMNGGTFSGSVNRFQTFIQSGGDLAAGSEINSEGFGQTSGTDSGAMIFADVRATAIGGIITDVSLLRTDVTNANGDVTVISAAGSTLGGAGTAIRTNATGITNITVNGSIGGTNGINATGAGNINIAALGDFSTSGTAIQTSGSGSTNILVDGSIGGTNGINATATGAGSNINITTRGAIVTSSTAIAMTTDPRGGSAVADILGNITVVPGSTDAAFVGSGDARFRVGNGVTVRADNVLSSVSGTTTLENSGIIFGGFQSGPTDAQIRNLANGTVNISSTSTFDGFSDLFVNSGTLNASGTTTLGGLEIFTNDATGLIDIGNGVGGDSLALGRDMANVAGSQIFMDIDLSQPFVASRNDVITVLGNLSSSGGAFVLNNIGPAGAIVDFDNLVLIDAGSVDPNAQFSVTGLEGLGLFSYGAVISGTDIVLRSVLDAQAAGGIVSNFITAQNSVSNAFFKPASGFVSSPLDPAPNQLGFSPWFRTSGGITSQGSTGAAFLAAGPQAVESKVLVGFGGYQFGLDGGLFNIGGSGASVHLGLTAGQVFGSATQKDFNNKTTMQDTFVGAYGILSNGPFFLDAQLRQEFIDYTVNVDDRGFVIRDGKDQSQRFSAGLSGGYAFTVGRFSIVPAAGYTFARTTTDDLTFDAGNTDAFVQFDDTTSHLAFAGVSASTNFLLFDDQLRVSPFVSATAYHDFGKDQSASLVVPGNAPIDVTSGSGKTYGEVSLGANFITLTPEIAGTQRLLSGNVRGDVQFGEDRLGGSLNAQLRLQF